MKTKENLAGVREKIELSMRHELHLLMLERMEHQLKFGFVEIRLLEKLRSREHNVRMRLKDYYSEQERIDLKTKSLSWVMLERRLKK